MARLLAREADFFSIGTNDLTQYVMAADRKNTQVAGYYSHYDPAVVRSVEQIAQAAREGDIPVAVCGEAGQTPSTCPCCCPSACGSSACCRRRCCPPGKPCPGGAWKRPTPWPPGPWSWRRKTRCGAWLEENKRL